VIQKFDFFLRLGVFAVKKTSNYPTGILLKISPAPQKKN